MAITRTTGTVSNIINSPIENSNTLYPEFKCRAWVNFNGTSALNLTGTYSQSGTTITVTINNHGLLTGHQVRLSFDSGTASWGTDSVNPTVTRVDNNTFTLISGASKSTSGNTTAYFRTIRGSGNVSNVSYNGTGDYTVNFITAIPDINYCIAGHVAYRNSTITSANANRMLSSCIKLTGSLRILVGFVSSTTGSLTQSDEEEINITIFR